MDAYIVINKTNLLTRIKSDIKCPQCRQMLLKAYNRYQEDERDGVDYIFDINNQDDLISCVNGGLTASEIIDYNNKVKYLTNMTTHFLFGCNHKEMIPMCTDNIINAIVSVLDEIIDNILAYPWVDEYRAVYTHYITNKIIGEE